MRINVRVSRRHLTIYEEEKYDTVLYKLDDIQQVKETKSCYSQYECYPSYKMLVNNRWLYIPYGDYKLVLNSLKESN